MEEIDQTHSNTHFLAGWRFKALIITVILSVIGYLFFTLWGGWEAVMEATVKVGFKGIAIALVLSLINYWLRFVRWQIFLGILGYRVPVWQSFKIYLAGFALTTTPGKAGEALRSVFLKDYGVAYRQSFGAFFAERLSDLIAVLILACCGLWIYPDARPLIFAVAFIICVIILGIQRESWLKAIENCAKRILPSRFAHLIEFVVETVLAFRCCYSLKALFYGISFGVIAWAAEGLALYYLLYFLGYPLSFMNSLFIYGFSLLVGSIALLPGGLGGTEVTMLQLLIFNTIPTSVGVAVTLVIRIATLWFSVILGLIALPKKQVVLHR